MNKRDYIGQVVIASKSKDGYILTTINAAYICLVDEALNQYGTHSSYEIKTNIT